MGDVVSLVEKAAAAVEAEEAEAGRADGQGQFDMNDLHPAAPDAEDGGLGMLARDAAGHEEGQAAMTASGVTTSYRRCGWMRSSVG